MLQQANLCGNDEVTQPKEKSKIYPEQSTTGDDSSSFLTGDAASMTLEIIPAGGDDTLPAQEEEKKGHDQDNADEPSCRRKCYLRLCKFVHEQQFPLLILTCILLAKAYPPLGAEYLYPQITASWIAVMIIFFASGVALELKDLAKAFQQFYFNAFVQIFDFLFVSSVVFGVAQLLQKTGALSGPLIEGIIICSCLPMAINAVIVLTAASGGDDAAAVFNTTLGNFAGIVISPSLMLLYLGQTADVELGEVFYKLFIRVVIPLSLGLSVRRLATPERLPRVARFIEGKEKFRKTQEYCLAFIVYTVFCKTFENGLGATGAEIGTTFAVQISFMLFFAVASWTLLKYMPFSAENPKLRVAGFYGCTAKTVALGIPMVTSLYEAHPHLGLYTLPLIMWHVLHLTIGSLLVPFFTKFIIREEARIQQSKNNNRSNDENTNDEDPDMAAAAGGNGDQAAFNV